MMLVHKLQSLFDGTPKYGDRRHLSTFASKLLRWNWERLLVEVRSLLNIWRGPLAHGALHSCLENACAEMLPAMKLGVRMCEYFMSLYAVNRGATRNVTKLQIGLGSPGYTGCMNIEGSTVLWKKLADQRTGVLHSMDALNLHIIGLPGARLSSDFVLPPGCGKYNCSSWRSFLQQLCCYHTR